MKIGIISINMYSKGLNFACPLHTYAFQQFLLKNGIESTVINYKPIYYDNFDLKHPYDYYKKKLETAEKKIASTPEEQEAKKLKIEDLQKKCDNYKALYKEREIRYDKFQKFIDDNYIKTDICYDSDLLEVMDPGFDCYICATDVIWKNEPGYGFDRGFFLASTCMENKWKIAYAGSQNARKAKTKEEDQQFFRYLKDIDKISVREASLKKFIKINGNLKSTLVVDPVLLHEKEFYEKMIIKPQEEHYLLLYYVVEKARDTLEQAVKYARAHNLKIIELTEQAEKGGRLQEYKDVETIYHYDIGIEEWLGYIWYADCIFTNSFHTCCFSALFEKKFFVGKRKGNKVNNILNMLGLTDRRFNAETDLINHEPPDIDYVEVRKRLAEWREKSGRFILDAIHNLEGKQRKPKDYETYKRGLKYRVLYNSGKSGEDFTWRYTGIDGIIKKMESNTLEFQPNTENAVNSGNTRLKKNEFFYPGYKFVGWKIRFRIDNRWFYYLEDGSISLKSTYKKTKDTPIKIFADEEIIPYIPVNRISIMVADAVWDKLEPQQNISNKEIIDTEMAVNKYTGVQNEKSAWWEKVCGSVINKLLNLQIRKNGLRSHETYGNTLTYRMSYNSGKTDITWRYTGTDGLIRKCEDGSFEYQIDDTNSGDARLKKNEFYLCGYEFIGWRIRFCIYNRWFYYLEDGTICLVNKYKEDGSILIKLFEDEAFIPFIPVSRIDMMVAEAVWQKRERNQ